MKTQICWILAFSLFLPSLGFAEDASSSSVQQDVGAANQSVSQAEDVGGEKGPGTFGVNYFGIFYGPSVSDPSSLQPGTNGKPDPNRPLLYKNFLGISYQLTDQIAVTPTAYWQWVPVQGGQYAIQDPYLKISDTSLISQGGFNLYADLRYHVPVSDYSRAANSMGGLQLVQVATYTPEGSRFTYGVFGSGRANFYQNQGYGNDFEVYAGPNVSYQISPTLAATVLLEYNVNHQYGDQNVGLKEDGTDIQPGFNWDVTKSLLFNPYVNIYPSSASLKSTSVGFLVSWQAL